MRERERERERETAKLPVYASLAAAKPPGPRHHNPLPLPPLHHLTHAHISHKPTPPETHAKSFYNWHNLTVWLEHHFKGLMVNQTYTSHLAILMGMLLLPRPCQIQPSILILYGNTINTYTYIHTYIHTYIYIYIYIL